MKWSNMTTEQRDKTIAEVVFGWEQDGEYWVDSAQTIVCHVYDWNPSTDYADMWQLVRELVVQSGHNVSISNDDGKWKCCVQNDVLNDVTIADTENDAVCLASLKTYGLFQE